MPNKYVTWQEGSRDLCSVYQFNTKTREHLSCPQCSTSIGIDYKLAGYDLFALSVRNFDYSLRVPQGSIH